DHRHRPGRPILRRHVAAAHEASGERGDPQRRPTDTPNHGPSRTFVDLVIAVPAAQSDAQPISPGSQVASGGNRNTAASTSRPNHTYGRAAWNTSFMVIPGGATPFMV